MLVIDDDAAIRGVVRSSLRRFGYTVYEAEDGEAGLRGVAEHHPSVVLVDLRMPRMDGHTFLRRFAAQDTDTVVVAQSADGEMDDVIDLMRNGAVDFLKKPWTPSELVASISRAFELYAKRSTFRKLVEAATGTPAPLVSTPEPAIEPAAEAPKVDPFARSLQRLKQGEITIPSVPNIIFELRRLMQEPGVSVQRIAALLERDQRMLATVLKLSTASRFAGLGKPVDLCSALGRIGLHEVHELVETTWVNDCFRIHDPRYHDIVMRIWRHSVVRALAVRALAPAARVDASAAYLGALLADVGACFLLWMVAEKSGPGTKLPDPTSSLPMLHEHHVGMGVQLLSKWGFSNEAVLQMVRGHHAIPAANDRYASLLVVASDVAANAVTTADLTSIEQRPRADVVERCARELGIPQAALERATETVGSQAEAILAAMG
ncbi:MAG TPA: HDOD domain-containing protein [Kofleriaceae bacterium]